VDLNTPRLKLRPLTRADGPALALFEGDPDVVRYQTNDVRTVEACCAYAERVEAAHAAVPRRLWEFALVERAGGTVIGRCGFALNDEDPSEATLWYVLRRDHWGRGLVPEAMEAVVDFAFGSLGLARLRAECDPRNHASVRVMEKLGMTRVARSERALFLKNEWVDSLVYALDAPPPTASTE
jgi:RimJ/RimL family protein N-acetyltransferase